MDTKIKKDTHELVRSNYAEIAKGGSCCCGDSTMASTYSQVGESYAEVEGYVPDADLGLGCGVPTEFAGIEPGQTVIDLGSGAGNDVFIARRIVGETGHVIGVDFTPEMIVQAEANQAKLGYTNVEFRHGEIENLPVNDRTADVIISNCVLNLVPDKSRAFYELCRTLKPGGHFCISDIVVEGELPPKIQKAAELYVGCVAGALQKSEYLETIRRTGFESVEVEKEREVHIPDESLLKYLTEEELKAFRESGTRILSITVRGERSSTANDICRC